MRVGVIKPATIDSVAADIRIPGEQVSPFVIDTGYRTILFNDNRDAIGKNKAVILHVNSSRVCHQFRSAELDGDGERRGPLRQGIPLRQLRHKDIAPFMGPLFRVALARPSGKLYLAALLAALYLCRDRCGQQRCDIRKKCRGLLARARQCQRAIYQHAFGIGPLPAGNDRLLRRGRHILRAALKVGAV